MTIQQLNPGDSFKIGNQRKPRVFKRSVLLEGERIPAEHKGKLLVILNDCRQMVLDPDTEVTTM